MEVICEGAKYDFEDSRKGSFSYSHPHRKKMTLY